MIRLIKVTYNIDDIISLIFLLDKSILLQALDEGYVILSIIKLLLAGPPAVGKTSFKHLLFNWKPPHHHHSTAIADRPIRAVEGVARLDGAKSWEMINTKELMEMLAEDIRIQASLNTTAIPSLESNNSNNQERSSKIADNMSITEAFSSQAAQSKVSGESKSQKSPFSIAESSVLSDIHSKNAQNTFSLEANEEPKVKDANALKNQQEPSATKNSSAVITNNSSKQQQLDISVSFNTQSNDVAVDTTTKKKRTLELSKDIFSAMRGSKSQQLSESTWIYVLDSGGQPQFADVSRAFVRGNTVVVIVHKLTDRLSSKPIFQYSIDGKPLTQPKELRMTNLQLITTYVRSISSTKLAVIDGDDDESLPTFIIVGTYEDKMKGLGKMFFESLKKKNAKLISALQQYKDQLIFYNEAKQELIFSVNNMCLKNREELSSRIRTYVTGHKKAVIRKAVPIRWYVFESNIKEEGDKEVHGIVSQGHYEEIGDKLGMNKAQLSTAVSFFRSLSVFLHFKTYSQLIFTNPQYFLDALSSIIRISFVDFPEKLLGKGKIMAPDAHRRLRQEGLFTEDLLDLVSIPFAPGLFEKTDLLRLLNDLCIVAEVQRDDKVYYFIPSALSPKELTENDKRKFAVTCEPLVLTFQCEVVPQVKVTFLTYILTIINLGFISCCCSRITQQKSPPTIYSRMSNSTVSYTASFCC